MGRRNRDLSIQELKKNRILMDEYKKNKAKIEKKYADVANKKGTVLTPGQIENMFLSSIKKQLNTPKAVMSKNPWPTIREAIKREFNSVFWKGGTKYYSDLVQQMIKRDPNAYETWRKLNQHQKIDENKFKWVQGKTYYYEMPNYRILIKIYDSDPPRIDVLKVPYVGG